MIALCSAKCAGTTIAALTLATAAAQDGPALLVEADPAGGDLAAYVGRSVEPGLVSLAAAGRRGLDPAELAHHTQPLVSGASVLLGPLSPSQCVAALEELGDRLAATLLRLNRDVFVDCGRWHRASPAASLIRAADLVLVVLPPSVAGIEHLRARTAELTEAGRQIGLLLVGDRPYRADEVAAVTGIDVVGTLAWDSHATADLLTDAPARAVRRSLLVRSARSTLDAIRSRLGPSELAETQR